MKQLFALLVIFVVAVVVCADALAIPPGGPPGDKTAGGGKDRIQPPPPMGVSLVKGILVKSEVEGGSHWLTLVVTSASGGATEAQSLLKDLGTLVPLRVTCRKEQTGLDLGRLATVQCHLSGADGVSGFEEGGETIGIAVAPQYGEKVTMGAQPEYDVMERILKDSTSDEARSLTADVLIGLPGKRSSKALMQAVYDISTDIRLKASRELVARQYEPAIEVLEALVSHDIADQLPYQIALAEILAEGGYKSGLEFLLRHLNDEEQGTVLAVVGALGKAGGAAEADTLEQLAAKTDNTDIAEAARQAAQQIHDRLGK